MLALDLHCHSLHSDGTQPAEEVARLAGRAGVRLFCLTDHDTLSGHEEAVAGLPGATVLRGLELSAEHAGRTVHLLVYGVEDGAGQDELLRTLIDLREKRRQRIVAICERLRRRFDIDLAPERVLALVGGATPGRPHVARALLALGAVRSVGEAFVRYLGDDSPGHIPSPRLSVADGLALARAAGAKVALAHPHLLGPPSMVAELCRTWRPLGLGGLEAIYGAYTGRTRAEFSALADALGLVVTAGSDYHGREVTPDIAAPGMTLADDRAGRLCDWLGVARPAD